MSIFKGLCCVVGAGPGLGGSVASCFAKNGYKVVLMNRTQTSCNETLKEINKTEERAFFVRTDVTDAKIVKEAFNTVKDQHGKVDVLVYNAGSTFSHKSILDLTPEDLQSSVGMNAGGCLLCAQAVLPDMIAAHSGTILITGATAAYRAGSKLASISTGKFALRALANSMAREFGPEGVHVCHVRIDCVLDGPKAREWLGDKYNPENLGNTDEIAETYFSLSQQKKNGWTNEIDIRPFKENWTF